MHVEFCHHFYSGIDARLLEVERCERMKGKLQEKQEAIESVLQGSSILEDDDLPLSILRTISVTDVVQEVEEGW